MVTQQVMTLFCMNARHHESDWNRAISSDATASAFLHDGYVTGMRRAELCHLKVEDIDSTRMIIAGGANTLSKTWASAVEARPTARG